MKAPSSGLKNNTVKTEKTGLLSAHSHLVIPAQEKLIIKCVASILVRIKENKMTREHPSNSLLNKVVGFTIIVSFY